MLCFFLQLLFPFLLFTREIKLIDKAFYSLNMTTINISSTHYRLTNKSHYGKKNISSPLTKQSKILIIQPYHIWHWNRIQQLLLNCSSLNIKYCWFRKKYTLLYIVTWKFFVYCCIFNGAKMLLRHHIKKSKHSKYMYVDYFRH